MQKSKPYLSKPSGGSPKGPRSNFCTQNRPDAFNSECARAISADILLSFASPRAVAAGGTHFLYLLSGWRVAADALFASYDCHMLPVGAVNASFERFARRGSTSSPCTQRRRGSCELLRRRIGVVKALLSAEVGLFYLVALGELAAGAGQAYGAGLHDIGAVGDGERHLGVLLH